MKPESMSKFDVLKAEINFHVEWGVWPKYGGGSICYCDSRVRAELVAEALKFFLSRKRGKRWLKSVSKKP